MITCRELPEFLSDPDLSYAQKAKLRFHLMICQKCRALRDQLSTLQKGLHNHVSRQKELSPEVAKKIINDYLSEAKK